MFAIFINSLGIALIAITLIWFLFTRPRVETAATSIIDIEVKDGIYQPAQIKVPARTRITLRFLRLDPTPCAEVVVFPKLNRSYMLPLNKVVDVSLEPQLPTEIEFTCQMGMYRGRIIVA